MLQDNAEAEVKKSDLTTGKWLNFEITVKEFDQTFDEKKGIFFVVNDEFGLDAAKYGSLENSGIDIASFANEFILGFQMILFLVFAIFNVY